jgi:hypothetical protein
VLLAFYFCLNSIHREFLRRKKALYKYYATFQVSFCLDQENGPKHCPPGQVMLANNSMILTYPVQYSCSFPHNHYQTFYVAMQWEWKCYCAPGNDTMVRDAPLGEVDLYNRGFCGERCNQVSSNNFPSTTEQNLQTLLDLEAVSVNDSNPK